MADHVLLQSVFSLIQQFFVFLEPFSILLHPIVAMDLLGVRNLCHFKAEKRREPYSLNLIHSGLH